LYKRNKKHNTKVDKKKLVRRLKRLAPKVPDYTCPDIDFVIDRVEKSYNTKKPITKASLKVLVKKLERLRSQNENIRELGKYWYGKFKDYFLYDDDKWIK
jgi:hypothetical protein